MKGLSLAKNELTPSAKNRKEVTASLEKSLKVPLGRKFIGLFPPNSVAEYRVLFIFPQKTEQQTFHPNIF